MPRVSAIMPFLDAEEYIDEAIRSVVEQTYTDWELILVDDGSRDGSAAIARGYCERHPDRIVYLHHDGHANRGTAAARNLGIARARGELIALLDADDRWLPEKLARQVALVEAHPEVGLLFGRPLYWSSWAGDAQGGADDHIAWTRLPLGRPLPPPLPLLRSYPLRVGGGAPCPSDLLLRRAVFDATGGFEESFNGIYRLYEDQAFLAKAYLSCTTLVADECWTWYRLHPQSTMARIVAAGEYDNVRSHFLQWLRTYVKERRIRDAQVLEAIRVASLPYTESDRPALIRRVLKPGGRSRPMKISMLLRTRQFGRKLARAAAGALGGRSRRVAIALAGGDTPAVGEVRFGDLRRTQPISRHWGWNRGQPVDRYYVERFLTAHAHDIRGRVLEVGDRSYTRKFGQARVTQSDVLHVHEGDPEATIVADLSDADHIPSATFDCIVLTQTLHLIYDVRAAARTLQRILAPRGTLLLTVPGITQTTDENWRDSWYWSFNLASLTRLAEETFGAGHFEVGSHGNVLTAVAFLHGLAWQELTEAELDASDRDFPVTLTLRAWKA